MSLFISLEVRDGGYLVAVDSRASTRHNGDTYCTGNNLKKNVIHNNKLIITFGSADVMKLFQNYCIEHTEEINIEKIFDMVINGLSKKRKDIQKETQTINLLSVFVFDVAAKKILSLHCTNTCERIKKYNDIEPLCSSGSHCDEAISFFENRPIEKDTSVFEVLPRLFDFVNCSSVGGTWTIFHVTNTAVKQIGTYNSGDKNVIYAPINILYNIKKTDEYLSSAQIIGTDVLGSHFYNKEQTAKLELGMTGNLGDMTLTRTSDGTKILQVYDNATNTTLKRDDIGFLYTSGKNTYMLGDWYYNGKPLPTYEQYLELEKRIAELENKI